MNIVNETADTGRTGARYFLVTDHVSGHHTAE